MQCFYVPHVNFLYLRTVKRLCSHAAYTLQHGTCLHWHYDRAPGPLQCSTWGYLVPLQVPQRHWVLELGCAKGTSIAAQAPKAVARAQHARCEKRAVAGCCWDTFVIIIIIKG